MATPFVYDQMYIREICKKLFTSNLIAKTRQIVPILGSGTWTIFTYSSDWEQFIIRSQQFSENDLIYVPYSSLTIFGLSKSDIEKIDDSNHNIITILFLNIRSVACSLDARSISVGFDIEKHSI